LDSATNDRIDGLVDIDYLVGTASAGLTSEIVVGPTPGGQLGGTWASPTVDAQGPLHVGPVPDDPDEHPWVPPSFGSSAGNTAPGNHSHIYRGFVSPDLGAGKRSGTFDITGLTGLTGGHNVMSIIQTAQKIPTKGDARDEFEMDPIFVTGYVFSATTVRCFWNCDGVVTGFYIFSYAIQEPNSL
jgi:hypothetical protein